MVVRRLQEGDLNIHGAQDIYLLNRMGFGDEVLAQSARIAAELRSQNKPVSAWTSFFANEKGFDDQRMLDQAKGNWRATVGAHFRIAMKYMGQHKREKTEKHLRLCIEKPNGVLNAFVARTILARISHTAERSKSPFGTYNL
jgi:hypothetical protein